MAKNCLRGSADYNQWDSRDTTRLLDGSSMVSAMNVETPVFQICEHNKRGFYTLRVLLTTITIVGTVRNGEVCAGGLARAAGRIREAA
jgi:hypothetical protein